jgi:hypothetical protein
MLAMLLAQRAENAAVTYYTDPPELLLQPTLFYR